MSSTIPSDVLSELVRSNERAAVYFIDGQSEEVRARALAALPPEARTAIRAILLLYIVDGGGHPSNAFPEKELEYFMPPYCAWDKIDDEARMQSHDWHLLTVRKGDVTLYDFHGWPGDNECGGGVVVWRDRMVPVFCNGDGALEPEREAYAKAVKEHNDMHALFVSASMGHV